MHHWCDNECSRVRRFVAVSFICRPTDTQLVPRRSAPPARYWVIAISPSPKLSSLNVKSLWWCRDDIEWRCLKWRTVALASPNDVDSSVWEILQETVYKTRRPITDLELSTTPLTNGCRNDDTIQLGPLRSQSLFQFVQVMMRILYTLYSPHAVINWIQIWQIWGSQLTWNKFWMFLPVTTQWHHVSHEYFKFHKVV